MIFIVILIFLVPDNFWIPDFVEIVNKTIATAAPLLMSTTTTTTSAPVLALASASAPAVAATAAAAASADMSALTEIVNVLRVISSWDPIITYGLMALGTYKTCSAAIEVFYERACFEVEKAKFEKGKFLSSLFFIHSSDFYLCPFIFIYLFKLLFISELCQINLNIQII